MRIGATDAKGTNPRQPFAVDFWEGASRHWHLDRKVVPRNNWIGRIEVQMRRNLFVLQSQNDFDHAGDASRGF